ncbi:MAG: hypothetical protein HPY69_11460 [Armatimonadetes bacterium]|nr:hypothetical protein [Armatimonadota bacterium]
MYLEAPRIAPVLCTAAMVAGFAGVVTVSQANTNQASDTSRLSPGAAGQATTLRSSDGLTAEQRLRREKCGHIWRTLYPWSYHSELVDFFCGEHERVGLAEMWWESLVYGASGSELRPRMVCRGGGMVSRGLMDCAWTFAKDHRHRLEPLLGGGRSWGPDALLDPWVSIRCHVLELAHYRQKSGRQGWSLLRQVFLPVSPDGSRTLREQRRWLRIEATHQRAVGALLARQAKRQPTLVSARP